LKGGPPRLSGRGQPRGKSRSADYQEYHNHQDDEDHQREQNGLQSCDCNCDVVSPLELGSRFVVGFLFRQNFYFAFAIMVSKWNSSAKWQAAH
jgi:hypothetical protein